MKYATIVGSRETPKRACDALSNISEALVYEGFTIRSGGADGADMAAQSGVYVTQQLNQQEIYIPWKNFGICTTGDVGIYTLDVDPLPAVEAEEIAMDIHPNWDRLSRGGKLLHTRNVFQVLGKDLRTPSDVLICYAKPKYAGAKQVNGGTATAVELGLRNNVPVYNLWYGEVFDALSGWAIDKLIPF